MTYVIGIGGTGARFLESLIHLCAAGLGPGKISPIIVDPDTANGNIDRVEKIIEIYKKCRDIFSMFLKGKDLPIFRTEIDYRGSWSPVITGENNLEGHFSFYGLTKNHQELCKLFYTEGERKEAWDNGFKGRANLGASAMADVKNHLGVPPWRTLVSDIQATLNSEICHVFIAGSIFGATGASGLPTIAKILREREWDNKDKLRMGGIFILPYFYFDVPEGLKGLYADCKDFLINVKSALSHYGFVWRNGSPYDRIYFIGDRYHQKIGNFSAGGMDQKNPLTWVDLIASSSLLHFVRNTPDSGVSTEYYYAGRTRKEVMNWEDIPSPNLKKRFTTFATLLMSYMKFFKPLINDRNFDKRKSLIPWYLDSFKDLKSDKEARNINSVLEYMKHFVRFIKKIQNVTSTELKAELFEDGALGNLDFGKLLVDKPKITHKNDKIFEILCKNDWEEKGNATGDLFHMFYQASDIFCRKYYHLK